MNLRNKLISHNFFNDENNDELRKKKNKKKISKYFEK
jgi:hypothetical protein